MCVCVCDIKRFSWYICVEYSCYVQSCCEFICECFGSCAGDIRVSHLWKVGRRNHISMTVHNCIQHNTHTHTHSDRPVRWKPYLLIVKKMVPNVVNVHWRCCKVKTCFWNHSCRWTKSKDFFNYKRSLYNYCARNNLLIYIYEYVVNYFTARKTV